MKWWVESDFKAPNLPLRFALFDLLKSLYTDTNIPSAEKIISEAFSYSENV
jgi:hypothetical protein